MPEPAKRANAGRVSMRALARELGVAPSTVSRALLGKNGVSLATRQRIVARARAMGFDVPSSGGSLAAEQALTFVFDGREGAYLSDVAQNPFYMEIVAGVEEEARKVGLGLRVAFVNSDEEIRRLEQSEATEGYLWLGYGSSPHFLDSLKALKRPTVVVDHYLPDLACDAVLSDNLVGARTVAAYVASLGHRRVAILKQHLGSAAAWERVVGFQSALSEAGVPPTDQVVIEAAPTFDGGHAAFGDVMAHGVTAVLCSNDMMAMGVIRAAAERGVAIPQELSVTGFDDISSAAHVTPPLTTVHVRKRKIGREAVRRLLNQLGTSRASTPVRIIVPTRLVLRGSTAPPSGGFPGGG
ncbi:MAG: LacI family DNA-binding transcriptional regulator [Bacillota bacterium]